MVKEHFSIILDEKALLIKRCKAMGVSLEDAEDLIQELMIQELNNIEQRHLGYYITAIRNMCIRRNKTRSRWVSIDQFSDSYFEAAPLAIEEERQLLRLQWTLDELPPTQRESAINSRPAERNRNTWKNNKRIALRKLKSMADFRQLSLGDKLNSFV